MGRPNPLVVWIVVTAAYALLSLAAYLASSIPSLRAAVEGAWRLIWLCGPPITLIHKSDGLAFYVIETVLLVGLVLAATTRRRWQWSLVLGICALAVWLLSGFLAIAVLT